MQMRRSLFLVVLFAAGTAAAQQPIRTGIDATFAPHAMPKPGGGLEGFNIDLANELAKRMGRPIQIEGTEFSALIPGLNAKKYDFLIALTLFLFIYMVMASKRRREGVLIMTFAIGYGLGRIGTDFLRVDKRFFGLTGSQWSSVGIVTLCALVLIVWAIRGERRSPGGAARGAPDSARPGQRAGIQPQAAADT